MLVIVIDYYHRSNRNRQVDIFFTGILNMWNGYTKRYVGNTMR